MASLLSMLKGLRLFAYCGFMRRWIVLHTCRERFVVLLEYEWLVKRVRPCAKGMRLTEFHQYLTSNGFRDGTLTIPDALQLAKTVLPTAVRDAGEDPYP